MTLHKKKEWGREWKEEREEGERRENAFFYFDKIFYNKV